MCRRFLFIGVLCAVASPAISEGIKVGLGAEFASVVTLEQGRLEGKIASGYRCMLENAGYDVQYVVLPHARLIHELRQGSVDVGLPLVHEASRDAFATLGDTVVGSHYLRVSLPGQTLAPEAPDAKYVYLRGFAGGTILRELKGTGYEVSGWEQAIDMLEYGRVDFLLITEKTFNELSAYNEDGFEVEVIRSLSVSFYVSNRRPDALAALNDANQRCQT